MLMTLLLQECSQVTTTPIVTKHDNPVAAHSAPAANEVQLPDQTLSLSSSCFCKRFPGGACLPDPPDTSLTRAGWSRAVFGTHKGGAANYGRPQGALSDGGTERALLVRRIHLLCVQQ